jgi:recombinational DNA repair protein RecT
MPAKRKPDSETTVLARDERARAVASWLSFNRRDLMVATPPSLGMESREAIVQQHINMFRLEVHRTPKLVECVPPSVFHSLIVSLTLGLPPNSQMGQLYMIPYGKQCTPLVGYRGYEKLALTAQDRGTGKRIAKRIDKGLVYKGQEQDTYWDAGCGILFTPRSPWGADMRRETAIGAYCAVYGFESEPGAREPLLGWKLMAMDKILERARRSQSYKAPKEQQHPEEPWLWFWTYKGAPAVWQTDFEAMVEKTVVRACLSDGRVLFGDRLELALNVESGLEDGRPVGDVVAEVAGEPVEPSTEWEEGFDYSDAPPPPTVGAPQPYERVRDATPPPPQDDDDEYEMDTDPTVDPPPGLFEQ